MKDSACRAGIGFDAHEFCDGKPLKLGGVAIPHPRGLAGHSDGDALLHAVADALLGALALPDIGARFPDTDPQFHNADSAELLARVASLIAERGHRVVNLDCVIICDSPKLAPYAPQIRGRIAELLDISPDSVGLQAKTCEGTMLATPGRSLAALVVALLERAP